MKLIRPSFEIITPLNGEQILLNIERAARTCYKSEDKIEIDDLIDEPTGNVTSIAISARRLIKDLIAREHDAMLEFGGIIHVLIVCDRGVSHELVRHRIASFAQESTRYCNYSKGKYHSELTFIVPPWISTDEIEVSEAGYSATFTKDTTDVWLESMRKAEIYYNTLSRAGYNPGQARSVLPNSLKTEINIAANTREWRHIFKQRTAPGAHPQMREIMTPLLKEFQMAIPILYDDIIPVP
jgi:thymidylate synthase (FAD)